MGEPIVCQMEGIDRDIPSVPILLDGDMIFDCTDFSEHEYQRVRQKIVDGFRVVFRRGDEDEVVDLENGGQDQWVTPTV